MNDEVVVYLAVLAQRGHICKDGFGHTEQLHSLVYDVGAQVIGQATAILSGLDVYKRQALPSSPLPEFRCRLYTIHTLPPATATTAATSTSHTCEA